MRIGVIGLGTVGQLHLAALRALGVSEVVGADLSAAARAQAEALGGRCVADYRELLATPGLDGVVIATPPRTHREIASAALAADVGVLCEKPMALTLEDCQAIAAAAKAVQRPFLVGFCHRFQPQVAAARRILETQAIGHPVLINVSFVHGITEQGREWITRPEQSGGGVLFDSGSHAVDLFRFLAGGVDAAVGMTSTLTEGQSVEDACMVVVRGGDVLGAIGLSWKTPPWEGRIEIVGSRGRARVDYDDDRVTLSVRHGDGPWRRQRVPPADRFERQMAHFLACLRGDAAPLATAQDGLEATRVVLAIYAQQRA